MLYIYYLDILSIGNSKKIIILPFHFVLNRNFASTKHDPDCSQQNGKKNAKNTQPPLQIGQQYGTGGTHHYCEQDFNLFFIMPSHIHIVYQTHMAISA